MIDKSMILKHDLEFDKGNLNIINKYLIPIDSNLFGVIRKIEKPSISIFRRLVERYNRVGLLEKPLKNRMMLWIPTNEAFFKLKPATLIAMFQSERKLRDIVNFHITPGYFNTDLMNMRWIYMFRTKDDGHQLRAQKLKSTQTGLTLTAPSGRKANSVKLNMIATNGIVNIIDTVLFPPNINIPGI